MKIALRFAQSPFAFALPLALPILIALTGCQSRPKSEPSPAAARAGVSDATAVAAPPARSAEASDANLTRTYAALRASMINKVTYDLAMRISEDEPTFAGDLKVGFELSGVSEQLALDFKDGGFVDAYKVNGSSVPKENYRLGRVFLPAAALKLGHNEIQITFRQKFSADSTGLYRFKDPEDGRVYVWTQFESYYANFMFPCFDQPDLKANFRLKVTAPSSWEVISTTRETGIAQSGPVRVWTFPETPPISTYLFSLHAGPYKHWDSQAADIPLRLFARRSFARYVKPEHWFPITKAGLKYYGEFFHSAYPFKKYDQVIAPDFEGAMENVAAVTFGEGLVSRGNPTRDEREELANTILHEMAHMWFGDLVTMRWWNGLWLNESFASYMASLAEAEATEFSESWLSFHDSMKEWAYREDQLVTTHPIEGELPDTRAALAAFDGITYGKGASVLKQLNFYLGADSFRDGVRAYFKTYEYRNTSLENFMGSLGESAHRDLVPWSKKWLMSAGVDTARAELACEGGVVKRFEVELMPAEGSDLGSLSGLRIHRTRIGLYRGRNALVLSSAEDVELKELRTEIASLVGKACPTFVNLNEGDHDYLKTKFDRQSLATLRHQLPDLADPLARMIAWTSLHGMVRDGDLAADEYLHLAEASLDKETNLRVALSILRTLRSGAAQASVLTYLPQASDAEKSARQAELQKLETLLWKKLVSAPKGSDWPKTYLDALVRSAETPSGLDRLASLLDGKGPRVQDLDQDRRWEIVVRLSSFAHPRAAEALRREKARDTSERGIQFASAAEAARPDAGVKRAWFEKLSRPDNQNLSAARKDAVLRAFLPPWQNQLRELLAPDFYANVVKLTASADQELVERYARFLMPAACEEESDQKLEQFVRARSNLLQPAVLKVFRVGLQEDQRCIRLRALAARKKLLSGVERM